MRVAVLGGTSEARQLAEQLTALPGVWVETSLAGGTSSPAALAGSVRVGGYGGAEQLAEHWRATGIDAVVDATHPFAAAITDQAVCASAGLGLPMVVLRRPGWSPVAGDDWRRVPDLAAAATLVRELPVERVLLTVGRRGPAAFAACDQQSFVVRMIESPQRGEVLPPRHDLVLTRGPFDVDGERELMIRHGIQALVSKDSGGHATVAKLVAARELAIPVVLIDRPMVSAGPDLVDSVDAALDWLGPLSPSR